MHQGSLFFRSLGQVLRRQRIVWWVFAVSFLLAWLGTLPVKSALGPLLHHSRASAELVGRFDMATFGDLISLPEVPFNTLVAASLAPTGIYLLFMLFILGGVLVEYREDRKLLAPEFFQEAGRCFWRMLRLALVSLLPFALLAGGFAAFKAWTGRLEASPDERLSDYALMAGLAGFGLLALWVRAGFDLAQARIALRDGRGVWRLAWRSWREVSWRLYGTYLAIMAVRGLLVVGALRLWLKVPATSIGLAFWTLQLAILIQVATRLWQRAACLAALEA